MRDILETLNGYQANGTRVAIARVVNVEGSAPRVPGAAMAVTSDQVVVGSVSGGCVEGAVVTEALDVLDSGRPRNVSFGFSDDEAFSVGLTCGGTIQLFIEELRLPQELYTAVKAEDPVALVTMIEGPVAGAKLLVWPDGSSTGSLGNPELDRVASRDSIGELLVGGTSLRHYGTKGTTLASSVALFIESFAPPPRMLVFGTVDFTAALTRAADLLGFRVTVCDARAVFATRARFPMAADVVVDWPDRLLSEVGPDLGPRDAVCVLTHDSKFDIPAVVGTLATDVGYIGVMGSRRTHADRTGRLRDAGVTQAGLDRLRSPIGLDLGSRTPEETAISIVAEIIGQRTGREAAALSATDGPIHG